MRGKILVILVVLVLIVLSMGILYFKELVGAILIQSEKISVKEISTMVRCKTNPVESIKKTIDGQGYIIPLPSYSAFYKKSVNLDGKAMSYYLTQSTIESIDWNIYISEILPQYGWQYYDQYGAGVIIKRMDSDVKTSLVFERFTHFYDKVSFLD